MAVRAGFGVIMVMRVRVAVGVFVRLLGGVGVLRIVQMGDVVLVQIIVIVFHNERHSFFL